MLIVGAGFSGLLCAVAMNDAGVPREDVRIVEAGPGCGGVWRKGGVGNYPGAACDVPAYTYLPLLQRVGFVPSRKYVNQGEISQYADLLAERLGITPQIRFHTRVTAARLADGARAGAHMWEVDTECHGRRATYLARHIVVATGPISTPRMPEVEGMGDFRGPTFHTARWDHTVALRGKRVGVVGTGASAAQVITTVADEVQHLFVFQRSPVWAMPRNDEATPAKLQEEFKSRPGFAHRLRREELEQTDATLFPQLQDPSGNEQLQDDVKAVIEAEVPDEELRAKLTPAYPFWCKRALFIDNYYSTFMKPNVTLVADAGGIKRETARGLVTASGEEYELDAIVYATGFDALHVAFPIEGQGGRTLADKWGGEKLPRPRTLFGIHVSEFPNAYFMVGPQCLNPVTNVTVVSEDQAEYLAHLVAHMRREGLRTVEPRPEAEEEWVRRSEATSEGKVWRHCSNWYNKSTDGAEPLYNMWMETHTQYLREALGREDGTHSFLAFSQ